MMLSIAKRCSYSHTIQRSHTQSKPNPTYSSEACLPIYMKDRKSFKKSNNAMEQELSFQKGLLQKKTKIRRRKRQDEDKDKTKTMTCAIFPESRGCKDMKYDLFT